MIRNDIGKALPELNALKLYLKSEQIKDKMLLVCFFDMEQRLSRNTVQAEGFSINELNERIATLREK